ncbi:TRAP transporter substrate-binding protein [Hoeflea sp. TYP-13]|uniref:TRAP transporter substrate-binding protein n=1 Tax=Hoeflea sp. TYP-13 TaxID=3230023 RepID=UPI0034C5C62C
MTNSSIRTVTRKVIGKVFASLAIGGLITIQALPSSADEIVARMSVHWGPTHHSAIHAKMFVDEVNKRADGRLRIEFFPAGQLFGIREQLGALTSGAIEIGGIVPIVSFPPVNKNYNVAAYPGLFESYEQQRDFFMNTNAGREIWNDITGKSNTTLLMFDPVGPVMTFSAARELDSVEAMRGLKARALIRSERPLWEALGANTVSLPTREVYTALQTGMIDTINSPPGSIRSYSWWEYLQYGQLPYQYFSDAYLMANADWFNGLPEDLQQLLLDVGREVGMVSTATIMNTGEETLAQFEERGGVVTVLDGDAKAEFDVLIAEEVLPGMAELIDASVLKAAQAYVTQQ